MNRATARRNIRLVQAYRCLLPMYVVIPVLVVFFQSNGVTLGQIFAGQTLFAAAAILFEVPSGRVADRFGYKKSMLAGAGFLTAGYSLYNWDGFATFATAQFLSGVGFCFANGADASLARQTLIEVGEEDKYSKFHAGIFAYGNLTGVVLGLIGGFLASYYLWMLAILQVVVTGCAIVLSLLMVEPKRTQQTGSITLARAAKVIWGNRNLRWLILAYASLVPFAQTFVLLFQSYLTAVGLPPWLIATLGTAQVLLMAAMALLAPVLLRLGLRRACILVVTVMAGSFLVLGSAVSVVLVPVLAAFCFSEATWRTIIDTHAQQEIDASRNESIRATILSVRGMSGNIMRICFGMPIALLADILPLQLTLFVTGMGCLLICGGAVLRLAK